MNIQIMQFDKSKPFKLPVQATPGSSGFDLYSANETPITIKPGQFTLIDTNCAIKVPSGAEAQVRSRSGLSYKNGLFVLNGVGTIDSDYRGSIGVILANFSKDPFTVDQGMRIAQLVINEVVICDLHLVDSLIETERSSGGFGSTGIK